MSQPGHLGDDIDWKAHQMCIYCDGGECSDDDPMVLCDCCVGHGAHFTCLSNAKNITLEDFSKPSFEWNCSQVCTDINKALVEVTNQRLPLDKTGMYTTELVRYSEHYRASHTVIGAVVSMFHSVFGHSRYSDGSDLIQLVCQGSNHTIESSNKEQEEEDEEEEDEDQTPDCSNFRIFVLRKGPVIVSAATVRVHGPLLAEVPYVVTKEGYRREGHCRCLMAALEQFLHSIGVEWVVVPAVQSTVSVWVKQLGFSFAGRKAIELLESRVIVPDETTLVLKRLDGSSIGDTMVEGVGVGGGKSGQGKKKTSVHRKEMNGSSTKRVRFALPRVVVDEDDDDDDEEEEDREEDDEMVMGCSRCGSLCDPVQLEENETTGDVLCGTCFAQEATEDRGGGAVVVVVMHPLLWKTQASRATTVETQGEWECITCHRYRETHQGAERPARLYKKSQKRRTTPAGTTSTTSATLGPTPLPATPTQTAADPLNASKKKKLMKMYCRFDCHSIDFYEFLDAHVLEGSFPGSGVWSREASMQVALSSAMAVVQKSHVEKIGRLEQELMESRDVVEALEKKVAGLELVSDEKGTGEKEDEGVEHRMCDVDEKEEEGKTGLELTSPAVYWNAGSPCAQPPSSPMMISPGPTSQSKGGNIGVTIANDNDHHREPRNEEDDNDADNDNDSRACPSQQKARLPGLFTLFQQAQDASSDTIREEEGVCEDEHSGETMVDETPRVLD